MDQEYTRNGDVSAQDIPMHTLGMMSYGALTEVIADNGFFMNSADLEHCRRYFFGVLYRAPSLNELKMLDGIIKVRNSRASSYRIAQVVSEDKKISETYGDLCAKAKYLRKKDYLPLSLDALAKVAPEYLRSIGCDAIEGADGEYGQKSFVTPLQPEVSLLLLLPSQEIDNNEYANRVRALYSDVRLYGRLGPVKTVNEFGLLSTIVEFSGGMYGDASQLPMCDGGSDISALTGKYCGRVIVSAFGYLANVVMAVAAELGLCAYYFGKTTNTGKVFFKRASAPALFLDMRFIKELTDAKINASVEISAVASEQSTYFDASTDMITDDGTNIITLSANVSSDPFNTVMMLTIRLLLSAMAKGCRRRDMGIKTEYLLSSIADKDSLAVSVSSILGVYRSFIELCVSSDSEVKYSGTESAVKCTAICKRRRGRKNIPQKFTAEGSRLYLLRVIFEQDGLPDFAALRATCKQIEELVKSNKILSAHTVFGDVSTAIEAMRSELCAQNDLITGDDVLGIILESRDELPMQQIGITVRK